MAFTLYNEDDFGPLKTELEDMLYKYGIKEITPLKDQVSHMTTTQKLDGIGSVTTSIPLMFLLISGIIIYIVLRKIIEQERGQIGVLKTCGIPDVRILLHYMSYAFIVGLSGGAVGAYIGISSVPSLISLMGIAFNMPFETAGLFQRYMLNSLAMSVGFSMISGYIGAKKCLNLEPAEAMRPALSKSSEAGIIDKLYWLVENTDIKLRLALRNMLRHKGRTAFIIFGIAIMAALLTFPMSMNSMYDAMLFDQFEKVEVYDMKISFNSLVDKESTLKAFRSEPGITRWNHR